MQMAGTRYPSGLKTEKNPPKFTALSGHIYCTLHYCIADLVHDVKTGGSPMSTRRMFREVVMFSSVVGGAVLGYCASANYPEYQLAASMFGMGLLGAFTDICIRGDVK